MKTTQTLSNWKRPFIIIWTGQAFSLLGSSMAGFALVWWLTSTTGSATLLAVGTLVQILPQIVLGPMLGALVDRWNRRSVMMAADAIVALLSLGLAALFVLGVVQFWQIYVVMFVRVLGGIFHMLAMQASTPLMAPQKHLGRIAGVNQTLQGSMNILAPAFGALLLGIIPIQGVLLIDVVTALLAVFSLFFVAIPQPGKSEPELAATGSVEPSLGQELRVGWRTVWEWPGLRAIMIMAAITNLMAIPAMSFLPLVVTRQFSGGVLEVGWMSVIQGIGLLGGGLFLVVWGGSKRRILSILTAAILMGLGLVIIGIAPPDLFFIALAGNLLFTFVRPVIDGNIFALLQSIVPAEKQGRTLSILLSGSAASSLLGLSIAGPIVDATSLPLWFILAGLVSSAIGISGYLIPAVLYIERDAPPTQFTEPALPTRA